MPSKLRIYTKNGDYGETSLCDGSKSPKDSLRVEAYGSVDETNSVIGLCILKIEYEDIKQCLMDIQRDLHAIGSNLAYPADLTQASIKGPSMADKIPRIGEGDIEKLEKCIDKLEDELPPLKHFILCGGSEASAFLHMARTVCRRAERRVVSLKKHEEVSKSIIKYLNRLSDYLFTAARAASRRAGKEDIMWMG